MDFGEEYHKSDCGFLVSGYLMSVSLITGDANLNNLIQVVSLVTIK